MNSVCIDLGSENLRVYTHKKGLLLDTSSLIAKDTATGKLIAFGSDVLSYLDKNPSSITISKPIVAGNIVSYDDCFLLVNEVINTICKKSILLPKIRANIKSECTELQKLTLMDIFNEVGARSIELIDEGFAAAMGANAGFYERKAFAVINMGAGKSEFAVLSGGQKVDSFNIEIGGNLITERIVEYVKDVKNCLIGFNTAEKAKLTLISATPKNVEVAVTVSGINTETKLPMVTELSSSDIFLLVSTTLNTLCDEINKNFSLVEPDLCSDIYMRGIALTGGMANIDGISRFISSRLGVDTNIIPNPELAVVKGLDRSINHERIG